MKGKDGDFVNAILSAYGHNFRKLLRAIARFFTPFIFGYFLSGNTPFSSRYRKPGFSVAAILYPSFQPLS
jgi:hypothetical protein